MGLLVRDPWFSMIRINGQVTLFREPAVRALLRSNRWLIKGEDHDPLVDTGLGTSSLKKVVGSVSKKEIVAVATRTHLYHVGGFHEFDNRVVNQKAAA